ncbi:MAG: TldD/PmbA family protein [Planctomycetes bacterium]|nr:TldD/PmbA family protein [Planctomycetota bacterium]
MPSTTIHNPTSQLPKRAADPRWLMDRILDRSRADATAVRFDAISKASSRFANNEITQNIVERKRNLTVRVSFGRRSASATANDLSDAGAEALLSRACDLARATPEDSEYVEEPGAQKFPPMSCHALSTAQISPPDKARAILKGIEVARAEGLTLAGSHHTTDFETILANSKGLTGACRRTEAVYSNTAMSEDASGWAEAIDTDVSRIDTAARARVACEKAKAALHPRPLPPGKYDVILEPAAVGEILAYFLWSLDARAADEGRSWAAGKKGRKLFADGVTLRSDAADPCVPGSPFNEGGMATPAVTWVDRGTLSNLCTSRYWARKQKTEWTGAPTNLLMAEGNTTLDQMIRGMDRGLLVTRFWYIRHVDPMTLTLTGMTRDGLFWVEKGKIAHGVKNFRFNESPLGMLERTVQVGRAVRTGEYMPSFVPPVRVEGFNFASATEF